MFLHELMAEEQAAFCLLARRLMQADGVESAVEDGMMQGMLRELGMSEAPVDANEPLDALASVFVSPRSRRIAMLELLLIACCDEEFHVKERELLQTLAEHMDFVPIAMIVMENWATRQLALANEAMEMLREEVV